MDEFQTVLVTHDFIGENEDEISLKKGEAVIVIEKDEEFQDGWWRGRNAHGEIGLFPMNYVSKASPVLSLEQKIGTLEDTLSAMQLSTNNKQTDTTTPTTTTNSSIVMTTTASSPPLSSTKSQRSSTYSNRSNMSTATSTNSNAKIGSASKHNLQQLIAASMRISTLRDSSPEEWTIQQVASWLDTVGFQDIVDSFKDQEITGDVLLELTQQSLKELGISTFGKRYKLHSAIQALRQEVLRSEQQSSNISSNQSESGQLYQHTQPHQQQHRRNGSFDDNSSLYNGGSTTGSMVYNRTGGFSGNGTFQQHQQQSESERRVLENLSNGKIHDMHRGNSINRTPSISAPLSNRPRVSNIPRSSTEYTFRQSSKSPPSYNNYGAQSSNNFSSIVKEGPSIDQIKSIRSSQLPQQNNTLPSFFRGSFLGGGGGSISGSSPGNGLFSLGGGTRNSVDMVAKRNTMNGNDGKPDMEGWLHKQGDRYKTWNKRWFVLRGPNLFYFKSPKDLRVKGIINLVGYSIIADESIHAGKYCFKMQHEVERTFYFYTNSEKTLKSWMRALMKVTISRNYAEPVLSSSSIATVSLETARRMRPRPPSMIMESNNEDSFSEAGSYHAMHTLSESQAYTSLMLGGSQSTLPPPPPVMRQSRSENLTSSSTPSIFRRPSQERQYHPLSPSSSISRHPFSASHEPAFLTNRDLNDNSINTFGRSLQQDTSTHGSNSSGHPHLSTVYDVPDENDEDLIDPQQEHITKLESTENIHDLEWKVSDYVAWANRYITNGPIQGLEQMRTGEPLIGLLEGLTGKTVRRQDNDKSKTPSMKALDTIVAVFRFMGREGITVDGSFTIKDVFGGDEGKIMVMLDAIKDWYESNNSKHEDILKP
ncbi:hypothetical protein BDA99DRAFT_508836 [Phascolomyces articulosus]|uniref:Uncharacterized protein n=1 Tax=Phascolomyces articulosus TaxID=60185 RepID=A0AAD5K172_9FUNG|nr:hypothetical protein BDA99DRAFT_508836 [Phascolomyces articulosus]